jgi:PPP family 3-phenylpropionic acid transporter
MFSLSLFNFIYYASMAMVAPFLPLYFHYKGLTMTEIGLALAIGPLVSIFAQPFWCYISDRMKTIKRVLLVILLLTLLFSSLLFMVNSFHLILLLMLAFMFVMTPIQPLSDSLLIWYAERHQKNYGSIRLWGCVGFAFSAVVIGTSIEKMGIEHLGILYEILVLLIIIAIIPLQNSKTGKTPVSTQALKQLFKNRQLIWFLFLILMISIPSRMNESIFGLFMNGLGASKTQIGSAWTIVALSEVPLFLLMTSILRRYSELLYYIRSGGS